MRRKTAANNGKPSEQVPVGKYDDVLTPFTQLMEKELHANAGKGDRLGWLQMSPGDCLLEIYYHTAKLQKAAKDSNTEGIREHAADVANMALMLADICGVLIVPQSTAPTDAVESRLGKGMSDDKSAEKEIQARGLTAPRITPGDIESNIGTEFYFTAGEGVLGASQLGTKPAGRSDSLNRLTFCILVMKNGFTVTGESACASAANFDAELGKRIARTNAIAKVWPLMGYLLVEQLHQANSVDG